MVLVRGRGFASEAREERLVGVLEEGGQMVVVVVAGLVCYPRQP